MKRYTLAALLTIVGASASQAQFKSNALPLLDLPAITMLAPRVKSIRAEPNVLTLHVGQTVQLSTIAVIALDSSGKDIARLNAYDFGIAPGEPAIAVPRQVTGQRVGTAVLTIHYSTPAWVARHDPRPGTTVKIDVKP